ncbi:MAG: hypothetical protein RIR11_4618 [Bacteroidota bacterium]
MYVILYVFYMKSLRDLGDPPYLAYKHTSLREFGQRLDSCGFLIRLCIFRLKYRLRMILGLYHPIAKPPVVFQRI